MKLPVPGTTTINNKLLVRRRGRAEYVTSPKRLITQQREGRSYPSVRMCCVPILQNGSETRFCQKNGSYCMLTVAESLQKQLTAVVWYGNVT